MGGEGREEDVIERGMWRIYYADEAFVYHEIYYFTNQKTGAGLPAPYVERETSPIFAPKLEGTD